MKNTIYQGSGVAIVTPMNDDGSINYEQFRNNINYQIENGTDAIVVCGTTGESSTMTDEEHIECMRFTVEVVNKRVPVIAGTGSNDTRYAIELSQEAEKVGVDALLVVTPYYNKSSQHGLVKHFNMIADSVNIPIILYNIPGRTGVNINIETYVELAKHKNIVAVKEASGNIGYVAQIIEACGDVLDVYSGNDDQIVPIMSLGGKGVISVVANILPQMTHDMTEYCLKNDFIKSSQIQIQYLDLINNLFIDVNPIPIKEAMNMMGFNAGECRMPLVRMCDKNIEKLKNSLMKYELVK
ncbi:MAG: 4-hydroxy-tetrahydrodipicolinate synthase [Bacteroidales bacterium]|jgi:4-hydroxy-tetrahydrodipicolinate synthase|nr:4-hydroxy-tetrahydrodipicolinate synthase [Bacteroidales bacterium]